MINDTAGKTTYVYLTLELDESCDTDAELVSNRLSGFVNYLRHDFKFKGLAVSFESVTRRYFNE